MTSRRRDRQGDYSPKSVIVVHPCMISKIKGKGRQTVDPIANMMKKVTPQNTQKFKKKRN